MARIDALTSWMLENANKKEIEKAPEIIEETVENFEVVNENHQVRSHFDKVYDHLTKAKEMTKKGGVLHTKVKALGGDPSHLERLHAHIKKACDAHEEAEGSTGMSIDASENWDSQ